MSGLLFQESRVVGDLFSLSRLDGEQVLSRVGSNYGCAAVAGDSVGFGASCLVLNHVAWGIACGELGVGKFLLDKDGKAAALGCDGASRL